MAKSETRKLKKKGNSHSLNWDNPHGCQFDIFANRAESFLCGSQIPAHKPAKSKYIWLAREGTT